MEDILNANSQISLIRLFVLEFEFRDSRMLILFSIALFVIDSSDLIDSINLYYRHDQLRNENDPNFWFHLARKRLLERQRSIPLPNRAVKNVILFIGDGMGVSTITAARILKGQLNGRIGEETMLDFDKFPHTALIKVKNYFRFFYLLDMIDLDSL